MKALRNQTTVVSPRPTSGRVWPVLLGAMLMVLLCPVTAISQQAASYFQTGAPPAWVEWTVPAPKAAVNPDQASAGQVLTLIDTQINAVKGATFIHVVKDITSDTGVQSGANLSFSWDPSYQKLIIHQITIERGTNRMNRLEPSKFKIIQQEPDLDRQVYNGTLSAVLFLEDVRVGDRIEYAYTVRGRNPSLKGNYAARFILGWPMPVKHRQIRLLWPEGRPLNFRVHGSNVEPQVSTLGGLKEYVWNLQNVPGVTLEDQIPSWFMPYPWLEVSGYTNWAEVAGWAAGLFVTTNADAPELRQEIANLRQPGATVEQTVQRALEFVQNDVRYLGIEFGPNSYHPTDPLTVLRQRYGDCKDKAFLFCTLLRGLGFHATPVLVSTACRRTLPDFLPAPMDFDHVIVRMEADGKTYWLDPTRTFQHGPIGQRYLPDYGFGLLVKAGEKKLTAIPASDAGAPETDTAEVFRPGGQKEPARLSVTTTYRGADAEWMRAVLAADGREILAKAYLNDYARRYPGVASSAPMVVNDSPNRDTLTITHTYVITNFWVLSADKERYTCEFYPLGIHTWIMKPTTTVRSMPMMLSFPRRRVVETTIELPRPFKLTDFDKLIRGPASELRIQRRYNGQIVRLDYDYRALTNFVPVAETAEYLDSLDRMEKVLGYSLKWQSMDGLGKTSQFNWPIFLLAMFYTAAFAGGAGFFCRHQCRVATALSATVPPPLEAGPAGLGGWLILVGIGLVLTPFRLLFYIFGTLDSFSLWKWHILTNPGGVSYNPLWGPMLIFELLSQISIVIFSLLLLVLFFQKRRVFPRWYIALIVFNMLFVAMDIAGVHLLGVSSPASTAIRVRNITSVIAGCCIWLPYMLVSKRVKATFVR